jgi:hypothetical protein
MLGGCALNLLRVGLARDAEYCFSWAGIGSGVAMISMGMAAEEQKQQGAVLAHSPLEKKVRLPA